MKLASVVLARTLAFVETFDLAPRGAIFYPDLISELVQRYDFRKFPKTIEEFDEAKGVEFYEGKSGKIVIQKFTIFDHLLVLETRSNTTDSKIVIEDMLKYGKERFGLKADPEIIRHWAYVSNLSFFSDFEVLSTDPLVTLARKTEELVSEIWKEAVKYEPLFTGVGHDPLTRKNGIAAFTISRRGETPFSEHKYFSEAPLPTDMHIQLLQEFEADMKVRAAKS